MGSIYILEFSNGKKYIGLTLKPAIERFKKHVNRVWNKNSEVFKTPLYSAWRKYGNPKLSTLLISDSIDYLKDMEVKAIKTFNTIAPNGYNLSLGGDISPTLNGDVAKKISISLKGNKNAVGVIRSAETRKRMSDSKKGCVFSEDARQKMAVAKIGNKNMLGYKHTDETKEALRITSSGKSPSKETRSKLSIAMKGRKHTEASIEKMRQSAKLRQAPATQSEPTKPTGKGK